MKEPLRYRLFPLFGLGLAVAAMVSGCVEFPPASGVIPEDRDSHTGPERGYDVEHYAIDLTLDPEERSIDGSCRVRFTPTIDGLEHVRLDFVGLDVLNVRDGAGAELKFLHDEDLLEIDLDLPVERDTAAELIVRYSGRPKTGLWYSGSRPDGTGPTLAFTHGQPEHSRGWFPCFDHPSDRATSELFITMPSDWTALAAGERIDARDGEETRTEHWRMQTPHPSYLTSLVAGELHVTESEWEGIPLVFAAEPRYRDWMKASFAETGAILSFLSEYTGVRYPYPKYSQAAVANFPLGGMENISATTLSPLTFGDEKKVRDGDSTSLVAHEAAHQWFGDLFTCRDWSHIWLNEGFATYMTLLYYEETRGVDEFRARLRDAQDEYLEEDRGAKRRPTVYTEWKDPEDLFDTRSYQGAAARLHLLRTLVGDDAFRAGVRAYAAEFAGRDVVTDDFKRTMEKVSGQDLDTFFDQWIYGQGYPEFDIAWEWEEEHSRIVLTIRQEQALHAGTPGIFKLPVDIEIRDEAGTTLQRVKLLERRHRFEFPVVGRPLYVRFDKHRTMPKKVTWKKSGAEWLAIAHFDDDVNGRRDAVAALGLLSQDLKTRDIEFRERYVAELVDRLANDTSPWVRAEAGLALGQAGGLEARERLQWAAKGDPEARVRVGALKGLALFGESPELAVFGRAMFDERYSWATMSAAAGLVCAADPDGAYSWLTERLVIDSPHDVLRGYLFGHMATLPSQAVSSQLRRWAEDSSVHPTARAKALLGLARRRRELTENSRFVAEFVDAESFRLRQAAIEALAKLDDEIARRALKAYYPEARTSREKRTIEAVFRGQRIRQR